MLFFDPWKRPHTKRLMCDTVEIYFWKYLVPLLFLNFLLYGFVWIKAHVFFIAIVQFFIWRQSLNVSICDAVLRLSIGYGFPPIKKGHKCHTCYQGKISHYLEDTASITVHVGLGYFCFIFIPSLLQNEIIRNLSTLLEIWWRGYVQSQYLFMRDGLCPEGMVRAYHHNWMLGFALGLWDLLVLTLFKTLIPFPFTSFGIALSSVLAFGMTVSLYSHPINHEKSNELGTKKMILEPVFLTWKASQVIVVGYIQLSKRNGKMSITRRVEDWHLWILRQSRCIWFRVLRFCLLWPSFQKASSVIHTSVIGPYIWEQSMAVFRIATTVRDFLKDYKHPLGVLQTIACAPVIGHWSRMFMSRKLKNVVTILSKIDNKERFIDILSDLIEDFEKILGRPSTIHLASASSFCCEDDISLSEDHFSDSPVDVTQQKPIESIVIQNDYFVRNRKQSFNRLCTNNSSISLLLSPKVNPNLSSEANPFDSIDTCFPFDSPSLPHQNPLDQTLEKGVNHAPLLDSLKPEFDANPDSNPFCLPQTPPGYTVLDDDKCYNTSE